MIVTSKSHAQALQVVKDDLYQKIAELSKRVENFEGNTQSTQSQLLEGIANLSGQLESLEERQEDAASKLTQEFEQVQDLHRKLERTVNSFQALRDKASKKLLDETKREIAEQLSKLSSGMGDFQKLQGDLKNLRLGMDQAKSQIGAFTDAASQLRKSDFTLERFSKEVEKREREHIRLARENERLKSLIGKMRRGRGPSGR